MFTIMAVLFGLLGIGLLIVAIISKRPGYFFMSALFLVMSIFAIWSYVNPETCRAFVSPIMIWIDSH
ncbi:hypothetical protein A0U91_16160 (plasmid) [Acetobacter persici]|uniref:Uncharacterized protein n=1 Tax=Acetobacter persici TaxID=1076596 RepID=A0A1U9LJS1_9PROT|nr:hypothetical protein A0U91_16160 [Acetobacter persici]